MVVYKIREIESFILKMGFEYSKGSGDHKIYVSKDTGFSISIPANSNATLPSGTAETILNIVLLESYITGKVVDLKKMKASNKISAYMSKQKGKISKNYSLIIPNTMRVSYNILNDKYAKNFVDKLRLDYQKKQLRIGKNNEIQR